MCFEFGIICFKHISWRQMSLNTTNMTKSMINHFKMYVMDGISVLYTTSRCRLITNDILNAIEIC